MEIPDDFLDESEFSPHIRKALEKRMKLIAPLIEDEECITNNKKRVAKVVEIAKTCDYNRDTLDKWYFRYQQGYSMRQVGKLVGVSHQTVNLATQKHGVRFSPQERHHLRLGARDEKLIEELISSGKTVAEVAPKHGISQRHAYVVLREAGVYKNCTAAAATAAEESVQYGSVVHKNREKIRTMYAAGYSGKNIAEEIGTTQRNIQGVISGCQENEELREQHRKNQEQFVLEDFDAGLPVEEISRKRGIPYPRICIIAKKHKRHYITAHDDRDYAVLRAYDAGLSVKDIADSIGVAPSSVYHIIVKTRRRY